MKRLVHSPDTSNITCTEGSLGTDAVDTESSMWATFADSDLVLALYGMICLLGIVGNLLVAIVLISVPSLRSNTSDFLIQLSLVDFIVCVLVIPFKLVPTTGKSLPNPEFFGELRCRVYVSQYLFWVCALISVLGLVTVNLERFVVIVYPHKYKTIFTRRNKYLMIASCWILGALSESFLFVAYDEDDVQGLAEPRGPSSSRIVLFRDHVRYSVYCDGVSTMESDLDVKETSKENSRSDG